MKIYGLNIELDNWEEIQIFDDLSANHVMCCLAGHF